MSDLSEYTLFCGKKLTLAKEEIDYLNDELTPTLEACLNKCPDEKIGGDVSRCSVFLRSDLKSEYTFVCGRKKIVNNEEMEFLNDPMTCMLSACSCKCPDPIIQGNVSDCPDFKKAEDEENADDPTYQEWLNEQKICLKLRQNS